MTLIQPRRDIASLWRANNPILAPGETGIETDTLKTKVGNGISPWTSLPYIANNGINKSKLSVIADNGVGTTWLSTAPATTGVGTSEHLFTVGAPASGITAAWQHWYTNSEIDTDPAGAISFNASLRVVSSSNPNTVVNTIYRITFAGRITATLDPGGRIVGDVIGVTVNPGDVVAIRTYLASGTAYAVRETILAGNFGGFTTTTDLTAPGSAAIAASTAWSFGPSALLGYQSGSAPSVLLVGDSIMAGAYDGFYGIGAGLIPGKQYYSGGGFMLRALSGVGGLINIGRLGDQAQLFANTNGGLYRLRNAERCNSAVIQYGHNDLGTSITAVNLQILLLAIAKSLRCFGISIVYLTTLTPNTSSTDGFATTTNQTKMPSESVRVAHNTWVRAGCPIDPTTLAPVAVGTTGALLAGSFRHPFTGIFDVAATVESALNSGLWMPCQRIATGSITTGSPTALSSTDASFQSAAQETGGDLGATFSILGAGASGGVACGYVTAVGGSTSATVICNPSIGTTVTNAQLNMGVLTIDGTHPSTEGHYKMSQAINPALLVS